MPSRPHDLFTVIAPVLFVILWSSGFIGAKLGLPYAEPLTFLELRFAFTIAILLPAAIWLRQPWPPSLASALHVAIAGVLLHGGYLGGVFIAIHLGVPAGMVALIVGVQPVLTAAAASVFLKERASAVQWAGFALGFAGVVLVVSDKTAWQTPSLPGMLAAVVALASITAGTLYQKRHGESVGVASGGVIQFAAAGLLLLPIAVATESMRVQWTGAFIFALGWLVLVLSVGAITLLYLLLRWGEASRVSSLFYATPAVTAVMAWALFGERLGLSAILGMALAAAGIVLVIRR